LWLGVGDQQPVSSWIYALVAPFPAQENGVSLQQLQQAWSGETSARPLLVDESAYAVFSARWGAPGPQALTVLPAGELADAAWKNRPSWAIVPFEALEPRWKVLEVDGLSPVRKGFDPALYPLAVPISLEGDSTVSEAVRALYGPDSAAPLVPRTNRDPGRLTTLAMTGVTALVRATAFTMEQQGIKYPGRDVGDWLREADLTHISNEVPFARNCPSPNPVQPDVRFCSDPRYIGLLEDVGADIIELTGDHFQDWGAEAMLYTLELYRERSWLYYGGGANLEEGRRAVTVEHNGNRLAFIGCNGKGGSFAQAGPNRPGAVTCDEAWMHAEITRLRQEGFLPIVTFQHFEYYTYQAQPNQKKDFRGMAQAGAAIVSGSQAHQPQAMEFEAGAFIHYGLGNLFFDQYDISLATRQGFIDRHVFYGGRYISTELLPILFVDYARPRPMEQEERRELFDAVFGASGW
jgi:poly-gamma-glutamate synthesis protein (capsule biosynthesis protein)